MCIIMWLVLRLWNCSSNQCEALLFSMCEWWRLTDVVSHVAVFLTSLGSHGNTLRKECGTYTTCRRFTCVLAWKLNSFYFMFPVLSIWMTSYVHICKGWWLDLVFRHKCCFRWQIRIQIYISRPFFWHLGWHLVKGCSLVLVPCQQHLIQGNKVPWKKSNMSNTRGPSHFEEQLSVVQVVCQNSHSFTFFFAI